SPAAAARRCPRSASRYSRSTTSACSPPPSPKPPGSWAHSCTDAADISGTAESVGPARPPSDGPGVGWTRSAGMVDDGVMSLSSHEADLFEGLRGRFEAIAYRLLGSAGDAEDAVQETFLRWHAADRELIETPEAWLTKVLTNLCLNQLTS